MKPAVWTALVILVAGCGAIVGLPDLIEFGPAPEGVDASATTDATVRPPFKLSGRGCVGLDAGCGDPPESCCAATLVDGGEFFLGYDGVPDGGFDRKEWSATLPTFVLDTFEVTVGRFRAFVDSYVLPTSNVREAFGGAAAGWDSVSRPDGAVLRSCGPGSTWTDEPADHEDMPINCVTWFDAIAFCEWDGGQLATDARWAYAAAGGREQREYPWGAPAIGHDLASYDADAAAPPQRVGSFPRGSGLWGQMDLAGNLAEWVIDWYAPYLPSCNDCFLTQPDARRWRVVRGGAFADPAPALRVAARSGATPQTRSALYGFRCARDAPPTR
jgi:formylglycine-generating enzyme required for sulfatase activity